MSREVIVQTQDSQGNWRTVGRAQNIPEHIQSALKSAVRQSQAQPKKARVIDAKTKSLVDMLQD